MKLSYKFSNLCGPVFTKGNVLFTNDGNSVLTPVGNHTTIIDLVNNKSGTLPFCCRTDVSKIELSPNGKFLILVDVHGRSLLINFVKKALLSHFNFKKKVSALKFSPDSKFIAVSHGDEIRIWNSPESEISFCPLKLFTSLFAHRSKTASISWSKCSNFLISASTDNAVKVHHLKDKNSVELTGHKGGAVGGFFTNTKNFFTISKSGALFQWDFNQSNLIKKSKEKIVSLKKKRYFDTKFSQITCFDEVELSNRSDMNPDSARHLVVVGLSDGSFLLHELPSFCQLQAFSVSSERLDSIKLNSSGDWIAVASAKLGQLLVWEWQSESAVLRQQAHSTEIECVTYSPDGKLFATGGADGTVKIWNNLNGFCFVTFNEHSAPVTKICFLLNGAAVLSSSLDGTVRAYDLVKYRCFRVLSASDDQNGKQFLTLSVDPSGKVVCAGSNEQNIYVWSLQTGKLTDTLKGHTGPVSDVCFNPSTGQLASCSWDGTAKLWSLFDLNVAVETLQLDSDALSIAYRPDGQKVCVSSANGKLTFWDVETGKLEQTIQGNKDIMGGRRSDDARTAKNSTLGRCFTDIDYSPDGSCIIASGESKFVCLYEISSGILAKKFQISENRSLDGIVDFLRNDDAEQHSYSESEDDQYLPGVKSGDLSKRKTKIAIRVRSVKFSPTGHQWCCVSTEGVLIYSIFESNFNPFDLDTDSNPTEIEKCLQQKSFSTAVMMSLKLGELKYFRSTVESVPFSQIALVVNSLKGMYTLRLFESIAPLILQTNLIHFYLNWIKTSLKVHRNYIKENAVLFKPVLRRIFKNLRWKLDFFVKLINSNESFIAFALNISEKKVVLKDSPEN